MFAFLYLFILTLAGRSIRRRCLSSHTVIMKLPWMGKLSSDFLLGVIPFTTINYFFALLLDSFLPAAVYPLLVSNILTLITAAATIVYGFIWERRQAPTLTTKPKKRFDLAALKDSKLLSWKTAIYGGALLIFCYWAWLLTAYVLQSDNGHLGAGFSVFSDYAPHTAVVSSFAEGRNFPTEYPHFAGDGIQYHFFFFFLAGNLQYLGLNLAMALNLPSALGLMAFCILLGCLAVRWTKHDIAFLLAPLFVFLRSSNAIWYWLAGVPALAEEAGVSVFHYMRENTIFIGRLPNDDWGLWNLNVFANQRHLLFVLAAAILILMIFLPSLKSANLRTWVTRSGWLVENWTVYIPAFILFICLPYWHGSVTIAILLILGFMAIWSQEKLAYLVSAVIAVVLSLVYTAAFSGGAASVLSPSFQWGFIAPDQSFFGVLAYLWELLGLSLIAILVLPFFQARKWKRIVAVAFALPLIFALTISLTPDVTVNHKYIMISQMFATLMTVDVLIRCWKLKPLRLKRSRGDEQANTIGKKIDSIPLGRIAAVILALMLTLTGWIDLITYRNKNEHIFWITEESDFQTWIREETDPDDIFLTGPWHYHPFFLTGRKIWYGHSYYAWSAGHDTQSREDEVLALFAGSSDDPKLFIDYCMQLNIRYVIITDDLRQNAAYTVNESFFSENFELVANFLEIDNALIYQVY